MISGLEQSLINAQELAITVIKHLLKGESIEQIASQLKIEKEQVIQIKQGPQSRVIETFEVEDEHSAEMQRAGWQAILHNFKKYTERR